MAWVRSQLVLSLIVTLGCSGSILPGREGETPARANDGTGPASKGANPGPGASMAGTGGTAASPGVFRPVPAGLRRLTVLQYVNTVRDLLGPSVVVQTADLDEDDRRLVFSS